MAGNLENGPRKFFIDFGSINKNGNRTGDFTEFNIAIQKKGIKIPEQLIEKLKLNELTITEAYAFATETSTLLFGRKTESTTSETTPITFTVRQRKWRRNKVKMDILDFEGNIHYDLPMKRQA
jgi:hypothetical protein